MIRTIQNILIADNDLFFVEFLSDIVRSKGYRPLKAFDGKEALRQVRQQPVALVFLDLMMPKITGHDFIRAVRRDPALHRIPIVAVSATLIEQLDQVDRIGADLYIPKGPMDLMEGQLVRVIRELEQGGLRPRDKAERVVQFGKIFPRRATSELLENLDFQKAVFEQLPMGVVVADRDGCILQANEAFLTLVAQLFERVLAQPLSALFPEEERPRLLDALRLAGGNGSGETVSIALKLNERLVRLTVRRLQGNAPPQPAGWLVVTEDIDRGGSLLS